MKILITGITGFFGRNFANFLLHNEPDCEVIGTHMTVNKLHSYSIPCKSSFQINLNSDAFENDFENIFKQQHIDYVIHSAANKYLNKCQDDPISALRTNTIASNIIMKIAKKYNVRNVITISSDKSHDLNSIYGISKHLTEELAIAHGYSVYKAVNFFGSDGSVLDIWKDKVKIKETLTVRNPSHIRYFNTIEEVCKEIYSNLDNRAITILPKKVYRIQMKDLFEAFINFYNYQNYQVTGEDCNFERIEDQIDNSIDIEYLDQNAVLKLIRNLSGVDQINKEI